MQPNECHKINNKIDMSEVDLIIHILSNLPEEYKIAISKLEKELQDASKTLDIEEVRPMLNSRYEQIKKNAEITFKEKHTQHSSNSLKEYAGTVTNTGTKHTTVLRRRRSSKVNKLMVRIQYYATTAVNMGTMPSTIQSRRRPKLRETGMIGLTLLLKRKLTNDVVMELKMGFKDQQMNETPTNCGNK